MRQIRGMTINTHKKYETIKNNNIEKTVEVKRKRTFCRPWLTVHDGKFTQWHEKQEKKQSSCCGFV